MATKKLKHKHLVRICLVGTVFLSLYAWSYPQILPARSVSVKVVTDEEFKAGPWQYDAVLAQLALVSDRFLKRFGIRLEFVDSGSWQSADGQRLLLEIFEDMQRKNRKSGCDVVLGISGQKNLDKYYQGAASYLGGYILLQAPALQCPKGWILEHEVAHLFGAVDLDEPGSLMNRKKVGSDYDEFVEQIIMVHRDRSFDDLSFPLPQARWEDAIELYKHRKRLCREEFDLNVMLSLIQIERKDYQAVEIGCQEIIAKKPQCAEAYNLLGIAFVQQGRYNEAIRQYNKAIKKQPHRHKLHYNLGIAYMRQQRYDAAHECYQKAIEIYPRYARAYCNLGNIYLHRGNISAAIEEFKLAVTGDRNCYWGFYDLGRAYFLKGKLDEAIWAFEHAIRLNQEYCRAYSNLAAAFLRKGMYRRAIVASQNALTVNPEYTLAFLNLASAYLYLGDEKRAKTECRKAIELDPKSPESHNLLGLIMECRGELKGAEAAYMRTVELAPDHFDANLNLGHYYLKSQSWDKSIQYYSKVLEINPDFPLAYINLAVVYYHKGRYHDAWHCVEKAKILGMNPNPEFEQRLTLAFKK